MKEKSKKSRLNEFIDNPKKSLWKLSLPMMFGMSVQAIFMIADTAFVGRMIGGVALASLGYIFPYFFIIMGITFGLGSGATSVIAQYIGAKDKNNAESAAIHTIILGLCIGIVIIIIGYCYGDQLLKIQGANYDTMIVALDYFYIMAGGSIFMVMSVFFRSILSGEGEVIFPMKILGLGTVINLILDPILIYYYQISGAAIATVISQIIVMLIFIYYMIIKKNTYLNISINKIKYNNSILYKIFQLGIPASLSMIIMSIGIMLFNKILGSSYAVAAYQTAGRIEHFLFLPIISIATSLVTIVGMFYGAKRVDLIKIIVIYGITWSILISLFFSIIFFFSIEFFIPFFTNNSEINNLTILYFKIMSFAYPFIAIGMTSSRIMQGLGFATPMFILTFLRVIVIAASIAWYFVIILEKPVHYAWLGTLLSCITTSIISIIWLKIIIRRTFIKVI